MDVPLSQQNISCWLGVFLAGVGVDMSRIVKILLVIAVIAWALVGIWTNFASLQRTANAVASVTSMATLSTDSPLGWRATPSEPIIWAGVAFILLFKLATAGLCGAGTFARAKSLALAGCSVAVLGLFMGWIVIAEEWFETWRSAHDAGELAFRFGGFIGMIALLISTPEQAETHEA